MYSGLIEHADRTLAANGRLRAETADLHAQARLLLLTYRRHRLLHLAGGSDADGQASANVAARIRSKIRSGALPQPIAPPAKCWVGNGTSRLCDACDVPIGTDQLEHELDIAAGVTLRFHAKCFEAWHEMRAEQTTAPDTAAD